MEGNGFYVLNDFACVKKIKIANSVLWVDAKVMHMSKYGKRLKIKAR